MVLKIYSVFDSKAEAFLQPFYQTTVGLAVRAFETAANEEGHQFQKYAGDYTLFELGEFDQSSGHFTIHTAPVNLGTAITYLNTPSTGVPKGPQGQLSEVQ